MCPPTCHPLGQGRAPYLMVTLGSWVTPQLREALVPLMTLWSCGGVVMRVRAAGQTDMQWVTGAHAPRAPGQGAGGALPQTTRSAEASSTPRELVARQV